VAGWPGTTAPARPELHTPTGGRETFNRLTACWQSHELIESAFNLREYTRDDELQAGPFRIRFCEVPHFIQTFAVEIASETGARLTYSADCSPNEQLVRFARNTDLLLIEATLPRPERTGQRGHLTPEEAGEHGRRAAAKRLVVTHFSDELDQDWLMAQAAAGFGGQVELACSGAHYTV
jgi:ribonuclease BN (tRNA processing enzyme)